MTARATGARFRQRKLSTKQSLAVVREHEVETLAVDDDPGRNVPHVETGVEKAEEIVSSPQSRVSFTRDRILRCEAMQHAALLLTVLETLLICIAGAPSASRHLSLGGCFSRGQGCTALHSDTRNKVQQCPIRQAVSKDLCGPANLHSIQLDRGGLRWLSLLHE